MYVYVCMYVYMYISKFVCICMYVRQKKDRGTLKSFQQRVQTQLQLELFKSARKILAAEQKVCVYLYVRT